ncbi:E3 ubiquitin-protein ligase tom1, partial [Dispira parvispora]
PLPPLSAALERIKSQLLQLPEDEIPQVVHDISEWKYPRGDFFQWIGVLNRFDGILHRVCEDHGLDKGIQTTPFSENTRAVLIAIFQFTRYLMENCINRNLYNSLTELRACLYTTHLDVLASALYVVVRIAQRVTVHHHRVSRDSLTMFAEPIAALSQWWGHDAISVPLVDLAQANGHIPSSVGDLKFNFYRVPSTSTTESSEPSNSTGLVSIDLPHAEVSQPGDVITLFHQLAERYQVPKEHRLSLLHRFLVSRYVREPDVRQQLLYCRLLGVSLEIMSQNELALENGLFRLEPNLAEELAAILHPERSVPVNLCAASMYALEALVRQRSRSQDVSTALNVSVSHGLLIIMLRRIFSDVYPPHEGQTHAFIDALTMLLAALSAIPAGGQLVVSAGMVTQLIGFLSHHQPWHKRTLGKLVRLLDNLIYTQSTAFDSFCNANGVTTLVERIGAEVQEVLAIDAEKRSGDSQAMVVEGSTPSGAHPDEPSEPSPASPVASFEDIPTETSALLKDLVRILHHMLQTTGNSDRLRNLVETALPKTMRHIVRYPELFGYSIYVYTINIMATMVHNEPTCLAILQELDLPDVFLTGVTRKILVSSDVLFSLPNAFGAICLNQTGLERFLESGALEKYIRVLTDKEYIRPLLDLEVLPAMASSLDELARHHPRLQQPILTCVQQVITSPVFRATPDELLDVDRPTKCTMCSPADLPATKEQWKSADDMLMAQRYDILFRFLEVFLQVRRHRHDMFKQLDPSYLYRFLDAPGLPCDLYNSRGWLSCINVLKMVEGYYRKEQPRMDPVVTVNVTSPSPPPEAASEEPAVETMEEAPADADSLANRGTANAEPSGENPPRDQPEESAPETMVTGTSSTEPPASDQPQDEFVTRVLHVIDECTFLPADSFPKRSSSVTSEWVHVFDHPENPSLPQINQAFHQLISLVYHIHALSSCYFSPAGDGGLSGNVVIPWLRRQPADLLPQMGRLYEFALWEGCQLRSLALSPVDLAKFSFPPQGVHPWTVLTKHAETIGQPPHVVVNATWIASLLYTLRLRLAVIFRRVATGIILPGTVPEPPEGGTEKLSQQLGEILVGHLTPPPSYQEATDTCVWDYYAGIMDHLLALLVDKSFRIQLQPAVLVPFIRAGGVHALLQLREVVWTRYTELLIQTSVDRKVVAPLEKLVEMVLTLLQMLISPHLLPTLPPVRLLGEPESSPAISPEALTVKIRAEALPGLLECWRSPSLKNCSEQILDALIECLAAGLQPHKETPAPSNPAPRPSTPINYLMHLNDLVDMGFPAAAARIALQRNFGSVARAADYLLNNPEVLQSANEEGAEGPRPESSDAAPQEESNDTPAAAMEVDDSRPMDVEPPKSVEQLRTEIESLQKDLRADLVKQVCDLLLHRPDTLFMVKKLLISECQPRESNTVSQLTAHLKNLPCPMHLLPLPLPREETQEKEPSNEPIPIPSEEQNFAVMLRMFSLLIYDTTVQPTVYESGKEVCELLVQYLDQLLQTIARAPPAGLETTSYRLPVWFSPALLVLKGYLVVNDDVAMSKVLQPREEGAEKATSSTESHATESGQPRGGDRALDMSNIVDTETEETVLPPNLPQYFDETRKLELVRGIVGFLQSTCHLAPGQMQAALDLLVQLTRTFACAMEFVKLDGVNLILTPVGRGIDLFRQQRDLVVVLLRHAIEHPAVLQGTIQRLLDRYSWQSESIFTDADLTTLVSNHDSLVLRDAAAFQRALSHKVESVLRKPADWQSDTTTPEKAPETTSADATSDKSRGIALTPALLTEAYGPDARFAAVSVVKLVIQQLLKLRQQEMDLVQAIPADDFQPDKAETSAGTPEATATENTSMEPSSPERKRLSERPLSPERTRHYHLIAFRCYLLQVLTELMTGFPGLQGEVLDIQRSVSMPLGKDLATTPSKPPKTKSGANLKRHHTLLVKEGDSESGWTQPIRRRSSLIAHIVHDLMVVSKVNDDPQRPCDALIDQQSLAAHTFLGMLCLEQQHPSESTPTKTEDTSSWDSVTTIARHVTDEIRGVVLDEVADAFKATLDNHLPITKRYSRLWALADFTSRLIIVDRKTRISNMMPVAHLLSALMLERRYASIIVRVLGGLDLNFPHAPTLLARLMLPLVHLTRYYLYHPSTALAPTEGKSGRPVETTDAQATPSRPGRSTHTSRSSQGEIRRLFTDRGGSQGSSNTGPDQNSEEARQEPGERRGATGEGQDQSSVTRNQADEDLDAAEEAEMMIPDFYRNSALFMYDGAMASELDGDSDDLEEDGYDEDGFTDDYDGSGSDISDEEFEEDEDMDMAVLSTSFDDENEDGLSDTSEDMDSEDLMYEAELAMTDNDANDEDASTARSLMAQDDGSDNARDDNAPEMLWDLDDFDVDEDIGSTDESEEDGLELGSSLQHRDSGTDRRTVPHGDRRARDASFLVESLTNAFMDAVGGVHHGSQGSSHPFLGDGDDDESLHGHGMEDDMDEEEDDEDDEDDEEEGMDDAVYSLNPFMDPDDPFDNDQGYPSNSLGVHRGRFLGHHHDDNIFTIDAPRLLIRSARRGPQLGINPWENTSDDQVDTLHLGHFPFSNRSVGPGELAEPHRNGQLSRQSLLTAHPLLLPEGLLDQSGVSDPAAGTSPTPGSVQATTRSPHARLANVGNQYPRTWIPLRFSGHANNGQWVTDLDVFRHRRAQATGQVSVRSSPIPQPYSVLESSHGQPDQGPVASQSHNTALTRYELPTVNSSATPWTEERFVRYVHRFSPWPTATRWRIERCFVHPLADPTRLSTTVRQVVQAMKPLLARLRQERYQAALGTSHGTDAQPRETNGDSPSASPGGRSAATSGTASEPAEERSASPTHAMDLGVESEPTGTDQSAVEPANHAPESPVQQMTTNDNNRMAEDLPRPASTENNIISDEATMGEPAEGEPGSPTPAQNENSVDNGGEEPEATEEASENMVMVGGRLVDISNTGIDPTFLSALPEDIREEVLREHLPPTTPHPSGTPQPQQPSLLPAAETEISQEFLE